MSDINWFDDSIFDFTSEVYEGKLYVGDRWRQLQRWKQVKQKEMSDLESAFQKQAPFSDVTSSKGPVSTRT